MESSMPLPKQKALHTIGSTPSIPEQVPLTGYPSIAPEAGWVHVDLEQLLGRPFTLITGPVKGPRHLTINERTC